MRLEDISSEAEKADDMSIVWSPSPRLQKRFVRESSLNAAIERLLLSSFVAGSNLWNFLNAFHTQNFRVGGLNVGDFELAH